MAKNSDCNIKPDSFLFDIFKIDNIKNEKFAFSILFSQIKEFQEVKFFVFNPDFLVIDFFQNFKFAYRYLAFSKIIRNIPRISILF